MDKRYNFQKIEEKWRNQWKSYNYWKFDEKDDKRPVFIIDTPPPFTNGELHMGHAYWIWINDTIARYKRMNGFNVLLPQGWDCHGLPTELEVQKKFKITKHDRLKFKDACIQLTQEMIRIMKDAMEKIGYSPDWRYEYRTMDTEYEKNVQKTLLMFFKKGLIYHGSFPTYWCPKCETALAQAETGYIEMDGYLYFIRFKTTLGEDITIATTRPELLPSCAAIAFNPQDQRYQKFRGHKAIIPLFNIEIPILEDLEVDMEFGTGVVMICSYGDTQDIKWFQKYKLSPRIIIDEKGRIKNTDGYNGLTIEEMRRKITIDLRSIGALIKEEKITHRVLAHTERGDCKSPIELIPRPQWFINILQFKEQLKMLAEEISWHPEYMKKKFLDWIENIDWNWIISRQRVFGTPLPFWYCKNCGNIIIPEEEQLPVDPVKDPPPTKNCPKCNSPDIIGEDSVCDVWLDSSITPLIISKYFEDHELFSKLYPNSLRQQGYDIIRTWAFYTLFRCYIMTEKPAWREILINGMILGPDGKEMSKSRGNVISPLDGVEKFGSDAMRIALLLIKIGDDYSFKWKDVVFASRLLQKLWSANRLLWIMLNDLNIKIDLTASSEYTSLDKWIIQKINTFIIESKKNLESYRFDIFLKEFVKLFRDDLCSTYLEKIKSRLYSKNRETKISTVTILMKILWSILRLFAPFAPFITEELYQQIYCKFGKGINYESIHTSPWPTVKTII